MAVKGGDLRYVQFFLELEIIISAVAEVRLQQRGLSLPQDFVKAGVIKVGALGIGPLKKTVYRREVADEVRIGPGEYVKVLFPGGNDHGIKTCYVFQLAVNPAPGPEQIGMKGMHNKFFHAVRNLALKS